MLSIIPFRAASESVFDKLDFYSDAFPETHGYNCHIRWLQGFGQNNEKFKKGAAEWLISKAADNADFSILSSELFILLSKDKVPYLNYSDALTIWEKFNAKQKNIILDALNAPFLDKTSIFPPHNQLINHFLLLTKFLPLPVNNVPKLTLIDLLKNYRELFSGDIGTENAFMLCNLVIKRLPKSGDKKLSKEEIKELKEVISLIESTFLGKGNEKSIKIMKSHV